MTKAMEGFAKRHPTATIYRVYDPVLKFTSYIFKDDINGFFDKRSVSRASMINSGEELVEAAYVKAIERRFYRR